MQEQESGFAIPGNDQPPLATLDEGDFFQPGGIWHLDNKVSSPEYSNVPLPVAPGGQSVPDNTAYLHFAGNRGLFRIMSGSDPGGGFVQDHDGFTWETFYRRSNADFAGNFYGNASTGGYQDCPGVSRVGVDADGDVVSAPLAYFRYREFSCGDSSDRECWQPPTR